uniref:Putative secreted protein n=1 Tax=Anopheles darlingi TaxID=43151 RepID=A0A2M4DNB1_ANODA
MGGNLALVQSFVVLAGILYPERPVAKVTRVLHQKPVVATVRRQADRQQLVVFPAEPGHPVGGIPWRTGDRW